MMLAFAPQKGDVAQLYLCMPMSAMRRIGAEIPGSATRDSANWDAFAAAAADLDAWALSRMVL
jgi:hypothetical protein